MEPKTTKNLGGRPKLPTSKLKSEKVAFRVTPEEKKWMDAIGNSDWWRSWCVSIAFTVSRMENFTRENLHLEVLVNTGKDRFEVSLKEHEGKTEKVDEMETKDTT